MNVGRIAAIAVAGATLATSATAESIKVATWNIENFRVGSRTVAELGMMADLVDILDADVIAVQEVDGPEAARSRAIRTSRPWMSGASVAAPI